MNTPIKNVKFVDFVTFSLKNKKFCQKFVMTVGSPLHNITPINRLLLSIKKDKQFIDFHSGGRCVRTSDFFKQKKNKLTYFMSFTCVS